MRVLMLVICLAVGMSTVGGVEAPPGPAVPAVPEGDDGPTTTEDGRPVLDEETRAAAEAAMELYRQSLVQDRPEDLSAQTVEALDLMDELLDELELAIRQRDDERMMRTFTAAVQVQKAIEPAEVAPVPKRWRALNTRLLDVSRFILSQTDALEEAGGSAVREEPESSPSPETGDEPSEDGRSEAQDEASVLEIAD